MVSGPSWRRNGWRVWHLGAAVLAGALGVWCTRSACGDMLQIALHDPEASQMLLCPLVVVWLIWVRRSRLRLCRPRGHLLGPIVVGAGWLLASIGYSHAIESFWHAGSLLVVVGCVLTVLGSDVVRYFLAAFVVLVFLVPVPGLVRQQIALPLQAATAHITATILALVGVEVVQTGSVLTIHGVEVGIAEACNGMRMVFALTLVCYAFAYGTSLRQYVRWLILAASPLAALLCNVIRLVPLVWLYGNASHELADMVHALSGWVMLAVAFLLLLGGVRVLRWARLPVSKFTLAYE